MKWKYDVDVINNYKNTKNLLLKTLQHYSNKFLYKKDKLLGNNLPKLTSRIKEKLIII